MRYRGLLLSTYLSRMTERRFTEAEVAAIFAQAVEAPVPGQRQLPSSEGMTLAQLREIGREVGILPEQLAQAAKSIELGGRASSQMEEVAARVAAIASVPPAAALRE